MILCCGEALIDMLPRRLPDGTRAYLPKAGGAVFNTAVAIGRLGAPVGFFSGLSTDSFGDLLRETLAASGVDERYAVISDRPTTLAFVELVDGQARYDFRDDGTAGRMLAVGDLPALDETVEALFFGGISLVAEPCGSAFEALAACEAPSRVVMLDPNIRPGFVVDEPAYRARLDRMIALSDIVKLSVEDLAWLCGPGDVERQAEALLVRGPAAVLLTRGAETASGFGRRARVDVQSQAVEVVDTIGAGDTFNAGVLTRLAESGLLSKASVAALGEDDLRAALAFGATAAAATVSRAGADTPWRSELAGL